ncbi:MAG: hypothetical protein DVB29_05755 [Verrucomicrobia bacterium]|nr:MAG: hypothetical protein DVB29_05755 [Verrucomicrobiota bacterium]
MKRFGLLILALLLSVNAAPQDSAESQIKAEWVDPSQLFETPKEDTLKAEMQQSIERDKNFLKGLPETYDELSPTEMKDLAISLESRLAQLIREKDQLIKRNASQEYIDAKAQSITSLSKEKKVVDLSIKTGELTEENETYEMWLIWAVIALISLIVVITLFFIALKQRSKILHQNQKIVDQYEDIQLKGSYLEYAARLIRHDLHSGINTYIPRGISSLERRVTEDDLKKLKIDGSIKMIKDGLSHTQRVYNRVNDFTSMVKREGQIQKELLNLSETLSGFLETTAYSSQVEISPNLPSAEINSTLFCTAIDNLIRNGLRYNDSIEKKVKVYPDGQYIVIEDNGRGMNQSEFEQFSKPHAHKADRPDAGEGLGLSICLAILSEHEFSIKAERLQPFGTKLKIKINQAK